MADDFTGVPTEEWRRVHSEIGFARTLAFWALLLAALIAMALVRKGIFESWGDLLSNTAADG